MLTETNFIHKNASIIIFSVFEEEDQSAYCLLLFVSAGKRMYLQHYALKSVSLWKYFKLYFCFLFGIVLFVLSLFICKGYLFLTLVAEERHVLLCF